MLHPNVLGDTCRGHLLGRLCGGIIIQLFLPVHGLSLGLRIISLMSTCTFPIKLADRGFGIFLAPRGRHKHDRPTTYPHFGSH